MTHPDTALVRRMRDGWKETERLETALARRMSIQEKLADYAALMAEFGGDWNPEVEIAYQSERERALIAIQEKLVRLARYRGEFGTEPASDER